MAVKALTAALLLAAAAAALLLLELGARTWVVRAGDPLDRSLFVLQSDRFLGWRQRPGLDVRFMGAPVKTDRLGLRIEPGRLAGGGRPLVLVLGPSSAFGWGVPARDAYPQKLQEVLASDGGLPSAAVINAGQIGYSSFQGRLLYRSALPQDLRPDFIVISYGANDIDRYRFFDNNALPDSRVLGLRPQSGLLAALERAAGSLMLPHLLKRSLLARLLPRRPRGEGTRRVSAEEYRANLIELARATREAGAKPIFVNTPDSFRPGAVPGAGSFEPAAEIKSLNVIMTEVGRKKRVPVLDAAALLGRQPAERMFIDPVHFSSAGCALIARGLADIIAAGRDPDRRRRRKE